MTEPQKDYNRYCNISVCCANINGICCALLDLCTSHSSHTRPAPKTDQVTIYSAECQERMTVHDYVNEQRSEVASNARDRAIEEFLECAFLPGIIHPDSEEGKYLKTIAKKLCTKTTRDDSS